MITRFQPKVRTCKGCRKTLPLDSFERYACGACKSHCKQCAGNKAEISYRVEYPRNDSERELDQLLQALGQPQSDLMQSLGVILEPKKLPFYLTNINLTTGGPTGDPPILERG